MNNKTVQQQELPIEVLAQLQVDITNIKIPYALAMAKIHSTSIPQMVLNIETGRITYIYDDATQKALDDLNCVMDTLVDSYVSSVCRAHRLVQS